MKITYDKKIDALYITLNAKAKYGVTKKVTQNVMVDYSKHGKVIGIEVLEASKQTQVPGVKELVSVQPA